MKLRTRKRLAILVLVLGLPGYIAVALVAANWVYDRFGRQPLLVELALYIVLGLIWILPLRRLFLGVGREE